MKTNPIRALLLLAALALGVSGCSAFDADPGVPALPPGDRGDGGGETPVWPPPGGGGGGVSGDASVLGEPAASANFVWVANTTRGTVAKLDASDVAIRISSVRVGASPTTVVASPMDDTVLVLNQGSVSVVSAADGDDVVTTYAVPSVNRIARSEDGTVAIAWFASGGGSVATGGALSEVTAFDLEAGTQARLSVGTNVRDVVFASDGSRALVVSDDGVSDVDLSDLEADRFVPPIAVAPPGEALELGGDVEIDIAHVVDAAVVRPSDAPLLRLVDLETRALVDVPLDEVPGDVDVVPGTGTAVVSLPTSERLGVLDIEAALAGDDGPLTWVELPGQASSYLELTPSGDSAVVFSPEPDAVRLSIVSLTDGAVRTLNIRKSVAWVTFAPNGQTAIVSHTKQPGEPVAGEPEGDILAKSYAYSVVDLEAGTTKLVRTEAGVSQVAYDIGGTRAFLLTASEALGVRVVESIDLQTLRTERFSFDRMPQHVGAVPGAGLVYVSQTHDLGRIAFVDVETSEVREVTGFELNSLID